MILGFSMVSFLICLCFAAGFLFASRAGKTPAAKILLTFLFGTIFVMALCGMAFAGCVVLLTTSK